MALKKRNKKAVILFFLFVSGGCASAVPINKYSIEITDLRANAASQLKSDLSRAGYDLRQTEIREKAIIGGETLSDYSFKITGQTLTHQDIARITELITDQDRNEPTVLRSSSVKQRYLSASGAGIARVELQIELSDNATAFFKDTDTPITLRRKEGRHTASFDYSRKRGEEHVDIYIVPDYAEPGYRPGTFQRISLSYPFGTEILQWDPWYVRFWNTIFGNRN